MQDRDHCAGEIIKGVSHKGQAVVLVLAGEIDMNCSVILRNRLRDLLRDNPPVLVVDMTEVEFMDSSGLGTLVEALRWSRRNGGQLKLVGLAESVRSIFEISRLETVFEIYDTEAEALS